MRDQTVQTMGFATRFRWLISDSSVLARRYLAHIRQVPEKLLDVTLQPLMFVFLFAFVFGGVIAVPGGGSYHEYLMGGIFVQTMCFGMIGPATSMATELTEGIIDRFRSLPMQRPAVLLGNFTAEFAASMLAVALMTLAGLAVGWRIHTSPLEAAAGFGFLMLLSMTMISIGTLLGTAARSPDVVTGIGFMVIFPLTFVAAVFVPLDGLPDGLRQFAEYNPVSVFAAAVRDLFGNPMAIPTHAGWPLGHPIVSAVFWCVALLAISIPITLRIYRKRTSD